MLYLRIFGFLGFTLFCLGMTSCGSDDNGTFQTGGASTALDPSTAATEVTFTVSKVHVDVCVAGKDVLEVKDGVMKLTNISGPLPGTDEDCGFFNDVRVSVDDIFNPYTVWVLQPWLIKESNSFDMKIPGINKTLEQRLANLKVETVHDVSTENNPALSVRASISGDREIVLDDSVYQGAGIYSVSFEYWYFK